ncbi:MAG: DUF6089 family protein [Muribaculaceae bacterium]
MKKLAVIMLMIASMMAAQAQEYRFEAGGAIGMSGYLGDANNANLLKKPGYVAGGLFRYIINSRMALKANLLTAKISGNSANLANVYPDEQTYAFSSQLYDLGAQFEFNFLNYGIGSKYLKLKRISPYLTLGVGATLATGDGDAFTLNVPMGVGVKYKLSERLNIGLEFTMRKTFSDELDGLKDLNGVTSGFAKNTDWYSFTMISITYEFSKRCRTCHYVE